MPPAPSTTLPTSVQPPIRSSDIGLTRSPFTYLLSRRLGIQAGKSFSEALTKGSWFHLCAELTGLQVPRPSVRSRFEEELHARLQELAGQLSAQGIHGDPRQNRLDAEKRIAWEAWALWEASCAHKMEAPADPAHNGFSFYTVLTTKFRVIDCEPTIRVPWSHPELPELGRTVLCAQPDALLIHKETGHVWIVDYKTVGLGTPRDRASTCPIEAQTLHYCYVVQAALSQGMIPGTTPETPLGGMIHVCIEKPTLSFGNSDRPYLYLSDGRRTKKKGFAKPDGHRWVTEIVSTETGEVTSSGSHSTEEAAVAALHEETGKKPTKDYAGQPDPARYATRISDQLNRRGEFSHLRQEKTSPAVVISYSHFTGFDHPVWADYASALTTAVHFARTPLDPVQPEDPNSEPVTLIPGNFTRVPYEHQIYGRENPYAPYYLSNASTIEELLRLADQLNHPREWRDPIGPDSELLGYHRHRLLKATPRQPGGATARHARFERRDAALNPERTGPNPDPEPGPSEEPLAGPPQADRPDGGETPS